jgi:hypothetical protein
VGSGAHRDRTCVGVGGRTVGNADEGSVRWSPEPARWSMRYVKSRRTSLWQRLGWGTAGGGCQWRGTHGRSGRWGTGGAGSDKGLMRPMIESERCAEHKRCSWVDEMEPDSVGGSLSFVKRSCGGSALWCLLTRRLEDGARSEEGRRARGGSSGGAWLGGSSTTSLGEERRGASASRAKQSG